MITIYNIGTFFINIVIKNNLYDNIIKTEYIRFRGNAEIR